MTNYIKVGRLVKVLRGPRENKVGVVTAIIDSNRILVENPSDDKMWRHVQNLKNVEALKGAVAVGPNASTKSLKAALAKKDIVKTFGASKPGQKIAAGKALAESTDFERYQLRVAKRSRAHWSRKLFAEADKKKPVSWHTKKANSLEKVSKKWSAKKLKARHDRIKKHFTAVKAKKAAKGKKGGKKK
jgi:large subunit ribosomal protein L14e